MDQRISPVLVTGATGNTRTGHHRHPDPAGRRCSPWYGRRRTAALSPMAFRWPVADLNDPVSVAAALDGAGRAYPDTPSPEPVAGAAAEGSLAS